jgi:ATP/maltotriose-dependent transcriptional regulator MalT
LGDPSFPPWRTLLTVLVDKLSRAARAITFVLEDYHVIREQSVHDAVLARS